MPVSERRLTEANKLFREADFAAALDLYLEIAEQGGAWQTIVGPNIELCRKRLKLSPTVLFEKTSKPKVRRKVLIADFRYPRFDMSAGELATFGIIKMFCQIGYEVIFVPKESTELDSRYIRALRQLGVACQEGVTWATFPETVAKFAKDIHLAYLFRPDVAERCLPEIRALNTDTIVFYHAPDVYFRREKAQFQIQSQGSNKVNQKQEDFLDDLVLKEVNIAANADHVVCVSQGDSDALSQAFADPLLNRSSAEPPLLWTFPLLYLKEPETLPTFDQTQHICFVGGSEHTPNRDAIRWFLENVWSTLAEELQGVEFHVIGRTSAAEKDYYETFERVVVRGWVESVEDVLPQFRLSVAPLRFGAGIKGKVGLSVILGIPCVATSVATEDMGLAPGREITVADAAGEYIEKIKILYSNRKEWAKQSKAGAEKAMRLYSEESTQKRFIQLLNSAGVLSPELYSYFIHTQSQSVTPIHFRTLPSTGFSDVSIVVPGFNNVELTKACLTAVYWSLLSDDSLSYEVIYGDDSSEKGVTEQILKKFPNLTIVETAENLGFVGNCNNAAAHAKGRYLVLLNNDTIVLPGWLTSLHETIDSTANCQVAGSKLLYANGKIQESGASIWTDARTCSVGRGPDGDGLEGSIEKYNYVREVDYVSFASVIIRKTAWDAVGGLGKEYGAGYFDDSDFCMKVRESGGIVLYSPDSEVIHNESASFSKRSAKSVITQRKNNAEIFRKKWHNQLVKCHPAYDFPSWDPGYGESIAAANAARHNILTKSAEKRRRILYFSPFPSHPASHGNQTTIQEFGRFLKSEGHAVHFVLLESHMYSVQDVADMRQAWDSLDIIKVSRFPSCDGKSIRYDGWYIPGLGEQIAFLCAKYNTDTVICSYIFQSRLLYYVPSYVLKIIDTHDKFTDRYSILDKLGKPREFFSCSREEEGMYLSRADVVLARRDEERDYFDSISTAKVYTVPHLEKPAYLEKKNRSLAVIGMVASCNLINLEIVTSTLTELIRQKPREWGFEVHVAGEVRSLLNINDPVHAQIMNHPHVKFLGFVDRIADFYAVVDMVICPIMSGTGINVKTVQALAYGMPLLATVHASKGIPTKYPDHQYIDVATLVEDLVTRHFDERALDQSAKISRDVFRDFVSPGYENFRDALRLQQSGLRSEIGQISRSTLQNLFSSKALSINYTRTRRPRLLRKNIVSTIVESLESYGPTWINLNAELPNLQSDGGVGFYFKFKTAIARSVELYLVIVQLRLKLHRGSDNKLFTISIPRDHFMEEKELSLELDTVFDWDPQGFKGESSRFASVSLVRV